MTYRVGGKTFRTKKDVTTEAMRIRDTIQIGEYVRGDALDFMLDLLSFHPYADEKIGVGVAEIFTLPNKYRTVSFGVLRSDGSSDDFSCYKCVTAMPKR